MVWVQFVICLGLILVAGTRLAKYGDFIAEKTGLGRVWIGLVLLATITSLPEVATGISSVTLVDEPNLTIGNLFGATLTNLGIVAIIDLVHTGGPVLHYLGTGIVLSTLLSMGIIVAAAIALYLAQNVLTVTLFGRIGIYSLGLFILYLIAQYVIYRFQTLKIEDGQQAPAAEVSSSDDEQLSLRKAILFFSLSGLVIVAAGTWLAFIGDRIAAETGLAASFVGTLFLAISTTAPEMVVSISAARLGALEMAVGNVVGSNLFNIGAIIFIDDLFYAGGPILRGVEMDHIVTALFAVLMSCVMVTGMIFRPRFWLRFWVGIDTAVLAVLYVGAMLTLFLLGRAG